MLSLSDHLDRGGLYSVDDQIQMASTREKLAAAKEQSDWDVIQIVLSGEQQFLQILYDRCSSKVYYKCLGITKNKDVANDLAHDIMIKIFTNLDKFKGTADFSFWVKSITYNYCMDYLKKKKKMPFGELDASEYEEIAVDEIELENKILREIQLEQLQVLFKELREDDRMILLMRYQDEMSIKDIATMLNLKQSAIKMRLKRSRDRLAQPLKAIKNDK